MTNAEKFKKTFGLDIESGYFANASQSWNDRLLFLCRGGQSINANEWLNSEYKVSDDDKLLESAKRICKIAKIKSFDDLGEKQSEEIILGLLKTVLGVENEVKK